MSSDPNHPEGWRINRDLVECRDDDEQTLRAGLGPWPTRWADPEGWEALRHADEVRQTKGARG